MDAQLFSVKTFSAFVSGTFRLGISVLCVNVISFNGNRTVSFQLHLKMCRKIFNFLKLCELITKPKMKCEHGVN